MTKARTAAARIRSKRGRPRKEGIPRTPSGQISRSLDARKAQEALTLEVATWRRRQDNPELTIDEARKPQHGSVIAKWHSEWQAIEKKYSDESGEPLACQFSQLHYDCAVRYHELYAAYMASIAAKRLRSSSEFSGPGGFDGADPFEEEREKRDRAIQTQYKEARRAVLESGSFGDFAMQTIVIENVCAEKLRGDLRLALNALARLWRMS